jgi:hypothetical protein
MKRLVIHAGMAKTGSSSIQESLWRAREQLAEQGVYYPHWQPFNHSYELSALFRGNRKSGFLYRQLSPIDDEQWAQELARLRRRWDAFLHDGQPGTYLVSAESLEHFSAAELQELVDFAAPGFDRVQVIVYVRHPRSAISSRFEQAVKQLREPTDPHALLAAAKQQARFGALRRWQKVRAVDDMVVRPFDTGQFADGQLVSDFLHALDLAQTVETIAAKTANTSLGRNAVAFLLGHNAHLPLYTEEGPNPERGLSSRQELFFRIIRTVQDEPLSLDIRFTEDEAREINREIKFVNSFLSTASAFPTVEASAGITELPDSGAASPEFLSDLVNALALELDRALDDRQTLVQALHEARGEA